MYGTTIRSSPLIESIVSSSRLSRFTFEWDREGITVLFLTLNIMGFDSSMHVVPLPGVTLTPSP